MQSRVAIYYLRQWDNNEGIVITAKKELISHDLSAYLAIWQKMNYNRLHPAFSDYLPFLTSITQSFYHFDLSTINHDSGTLYYLHYYEYLLNAYSNLQLSLQESSKNSQQYLQSQIKKMNHLCKYKHGLLEGVTKIFNLVW